VTPLISTADYIVKRFLVDEFPMDFAPRFTGFKVPQESTTLVGQILFYGRFAFPSGRVGYTFWHITVPLPIESAQKDLEGVVRTYAKGACQRAAHLKRVAETGWLLASDRRVRRITKAEWLPYETARPSHPQYTVHKRRHDMAYWRWKAKQEAL
jgi:hypothetical protein